MLQTALDALSRWWRTCDAVASREAVRLLRTAHDDDPSDPVRGAALGVALLRGVDVQVVGSIGHNFRAAHHTSNAESEGRRLLAEAARDWPLPELGLELAAVGLATRNEQTLGFALEILTLLSRLHTDRADLHVALSEVFVALGAFDDAVKAATEAVALGAATGQHALGVAMILSEREGSLGAAQYLAGLASLDADALERYGEDLRPLLDAQGAREVGSLAAAERGEWVRARWDWLASTSGWTPEERVALQVRRLDYAIRHYMRHSHRGARPVEALVSDSVTVHSPFDDRGLMHLRHGAPNEVIRAAGGRAGVAREAWVYYGLAGRRGVFEFRKYADRADYYLSAPAACDPFVYMYGESGIRGEQRYRRGEPKQSQWEADFERGVLDYGLALAVYAPSVGSDAVRCHTLVKRGRLLDELAWIRLHEASRRATAYREVRRALNSESAPRRFERPLRVAASTYGFRGSNGRTQLFAFVLIPGDGLTPTDRGGQLEYAHQFSLAVEDPARRSVLRVDTTFRPVTRNPLEADQALRTRLDLTVPSTSAADVRIVISNPTRPEEGQQLLISRPIPDFASDRLSLSDLVIGEDGSSLQRGAVSLSPLPGHTLEVGSSFRLFYEVYGLTPQAGYRTSIVLAPTTEPELLGRIRSLFEDKHVMELGFEDVARPTDDGVVQIDRTLVPALDPRAYVLRVLIEDKTTGAATASEADLLIIQPRR